MNQFDFPAPREFQKRAMQKLREGILEGHKDQLCVGPTGSGKTFLALWLASSALEKGKRAIFMCDRRTLIEQTARTAWNYGFRDLSIVMGDNWAEYRPDAKFQICSAQTIHRRKWPEADVIIIDEAHTQLSVWTEHIKKASAVTVGLTATPFSKGLGNLFSRVVNSATMKELTETGVLVGMKIYSCASPDMRGAKTNSKGEWHENEAAERGMEIIGDVVSEWRKLGENRKTICFGSNIKHCEEIVRAFNEAGIFAMLFTSKTTDVERKDILAEYEKPDSRIKILVSVEALAKGFDVPDVGCVIDCRPLRKSLSTAIQMWGRGLRSTRDGQKSDCILIDHSGNIVRFAEDFEEFYHNGVDSLDDGEKLDSTVRKDNEEISDKGCPKCGYTPFRKICMSCGHEKVSTSDVVHELGEAYELELSVNANKRAQQIRFYGELLMYAQNHSYSEGWAAHKYREKFGIFPPRSFPKAFAPVTTETANWIKSRRIAWVKAQQKARASA